MKRLLPASLFGQTMAIILVGMALSQLLGIWIYDSDRAEAVRAVGGLTVAQRAVNAARLIEESGPANRIRLAERLSDPTFQLSLGEAAPKADALTARTPDAEVIRDFLVDSLSLASPARVVVALGEPTEHEMHGGRHGMGMEMGHMGGRAMGAWRRMLIGVQLSDGPWLTTMAGVPDQPLSRPWWFFAALAGMGATVLAASAWAVRRVTAPLRLLGEAAGRLARDVTAAPLEESGPSEIRRAVRAFNRMQASLGRLVENRSRLLAAVSHDLRTPLTLLRLRAEEVAEGDNRERMLATIGEMDEMVGAALDFARNTAQSEARRPTDLAALVASIVDDMADAGLPVSLVAAAPAVLPIQAGAMRRALANLVGNAVRYGGGARLAVARTVAGVEITVDDDGPGIPEAELERVFEPFYRLEQSRNAATGGSGLGLAIAQSILVNHGGRITLANRPQGGLRALATLPG